MKTSVYDSETFEGSDYSEKKLSGIEFVNCIFSNCDFTKSDLSGNNFEDCIFQRCNFSLTKLRGTGLKSVKFIECKLMGIDFSVTNGFAFSVYFQNSLLDYSSFFGCKMKKTTFSDCSLKQVDFSETDLSMAVFKNCDMSFTTFARTNLEKADFRSAVHYAIDPEQNKLKGARFSNLGLSGLLHKYNLSISH